MKTFLAISLFFFMAFCESDAEAAKLGRVIVDKADIHEFPKQDSKVIGSLVKDSQAAVSNLPTEGFYKIRLDSGELGWISGNDVLVKIDPKKDGSAGSDREETIAPEKEDEDENLRKKKTGISRFLLGFGVQSPYYGGLGQYFVTTGLNPGYGVLAELQSQMGASSWYWALRGEYTFTGSASNELTQSDGNTVEQTMKQSGIPLQIGLNWSMIDRPSFRWGWGAYAGFALFSSVTVEQKGVQQNTVSFSSHDPCMTLVTQFSFGLGKTSSWLIEIGYRLQKSGTMAGTSWESPTDDVPEFAIDYSGMLMRVGLEF